MPKVTVTTTVQYTKAGRCSQTCAHLRKESYWAWAGYKRYHTCALFGCAQLKKTEGNPMRHRKCIEAENGK